MDLDASDARTLTQAIIELEDGYVFDVVAMRGRAADLERRARELDEPLLAARARLCLGHLWLRSGDLAQASRIIATVNRWASAHRAQQLLARSHSLWATLYRHLGDGAAALDHMLIAFEFMDETASAYQQIWTRTKLADALGENGAIVAARERYAQAEDLAVRHHQARLHLGTLNNWAWIECQAGHPDRASEITARMVALAAGYDLAPEPADLETMAAVHLANGRFTQAEQLLAVCIDLHGNGEDEDADALAEYLLSLARARRGSGALDTAQQALDSSRALCSERGLGSILVRVHEEQAELHATRGEFAAAFAARKDFFAAHCGLQSPQREAQAFKRQAILEAAEARRDAARFREEAGRDPLTGLYNRRFLEETIPGLLASGAPCAMAVVDIDHFKSINDQLSHDVGDQVLVAVAELLEAGVTAMTPDGFVVRLGGEEFLLVVPGMSGSDACGPLDLVRQTIRDHPWRGLTGSFPVTVSVGVAGIGEDGDRTRNAVLSRADSRLYEAKNAGRDRLIGKEP
jgi:diguanylate cyclase (GGDEF)-like protein